MRYVPPTLRLPMLMLGMIALVMEVARLALEVPVLAQSLFILASAVLATASYMVLRQQSPLFTATLTFLALTIANERLELTRFRPPRLIARQLSILTLLASVLRGVPNRGVKP
ncbi:MAG: hypothetical protein ACYCY1_16915 [Sulfuriferula sp.]